MLDRTNQTPPANIDAEKALLGAILIDNAVLERIAGLVEPEDFSDPIHANLFAIMARMSSEAIAITPTTLKPFVADWPDILHGMTVSRYIVGLGINATTTMNAPSYALTVREQSARRKLFHLGTDMAASSSNAEISVQALASEAVTALDHVLSISRIKGRSSVMIGEAISEALDSVLNDDGSSRITSGLADIDKTLGGGWRRKQYAILAGRPSMGKTTVATSAMLKTAKAGHGVFFLSLEMSTRDLAFRAVSDLCYGAKTRIEYNRLLAGTATQGDWSVISKATDSFAQLPLAIDDAPALTIADIGARIRAQAKRFDKAGTKLALVVIDHLGCIRASERYRGNRVNEVTEISSGLVQIAKESDVALVVLSQLNRGTEGRDNKRPSLADLRDSGSLEQDADVVIFAYREAYYLERQKHDAGSQAELARQTELEATRNTLELLVAKNRNGPTATVNMFCDMGCNAVRGLG